MLFESKLTIKHYIKDFKIAKSQSNTAFNPPQWVNLHRFYPVNHVIISAVGVKIKKVFVMSVSKTVKRPSVSTLSISFHNVDRVKPGLHEH